MPRCRGLFVRMRASAQQELDATRDKGCRQLLARSIRQLTVHIERLDREIAAVIESDEKMKRLSEALKTIRGQHRWWWRWSPNWA